MSDIFSLEKKNILIVGASSGIGCHSAKLFAERGAHLILAARRKSMLDVLADTLRTPNIKIETHSMDVTQEESIEDTLSKIKDPIDVVLNTAGINIRKPMLEHTSKDWDDLMAVNLKGAWTLSQAMIKHMIATKTKGKIIHMSSIFGSLTNSQQVLYATSKAGIEHLTRSLALECAPYGIQMNAIAPGYFETGLNRAALHAGLGKYVIERTPLARLGMLEDLDGVLILLASAASNYITGAVIPVDGGCAAHHF